MDSNAVSRLSSQQRAILLLVHAGRSSKEIGRELSLSPSYVDNEVILARRILGARTRLDAANLLISIENDAALQSIGQPRPIERVARGAIAVGQPSTGRRWPFPTKGRAYNDLSFRERMIWVFAIAFLSILIVGFLVDSLERLGRMI